MFAECLELLEGFLESLNSLDLFGFDPQVHFVL